MDYPVNPCPYCGATHGRLLRDHLGAVGWCRTCHRTWIAPTVRPVAQTRPEREDDGLRRRVA